MLENQARELDLRGNELELRKQADKHQLEYAKEALAAQQTLIAIC